MTIRRHSAYKSLHEYCDMDSIRKTILIFVTLLIVGLKLHYEYYNLIFPILSMVTIAIILKKHRISKGHKMVFLFVLTINLLCLVFPDKTLYRLRKNHRYFWSEKPLNLSYFNVRRDIEGDTAAIVNPIIVGEINKFFNYPPAILFTSDYIGRSWINESSLDDSLESKKALKVLLEHEKSHFDIMEIYTREAQDSLNQMVLSTYAEKYDVINYFLKVSDSIQNKFDLDTDH